ncbi:MAG TPA: carboxypeptidase-like regulatory domain-containing protein, partial [Draconibacterium sp.]|nr:carboxypeptidase-like regulatory domain-containing protein [Draconibacterium sp.]
MKKIAFFLSILLFMGTLAVNGQTKEMTGKVTSSDDGMPIPGVSIAVKGTTLGTITNLDGDYTLQVPQDAETLIFSFVGMITQEISIAGKNNINVILEPLTIGVDEVVVTAMGINRPKREMTYQTQNVKSEDLVKVSPT